MDDAGERGRRLQELLQQAQELTARQQQLRQQRPAVSAQATRAERRAFARWETKFEQLTQEVERLDAEVTAELARWKAQRPTPRK